MRTQWKPPCSDARQLCSVHRNVWSLFFSEHSALSCGLFFLFFFCRFVSLTTPLKKKKEPSELAGLHHPQHTSSVSLRWLQAEGVGGGKKWSWFAVSNLWKRFHLFIFPWSLQLMAPLLSAHRQRSFTSHLKLPSHCSIKACLSVFVVVFIFVLPFPLDFLPVSSSESILWPDPGLHYILSTHTFLSPHSHSHGVNIMAFCCALGQHACIWLASNVLRLFFFPRWVILCAPVKSRAYMKSFIYLINTAS